MNRNETYLVFVCRPAINYVNAASGGGAVHDFILGTR